MHPYIYRILVAFASALQLFIRLECPTLVIPTLLTVSVIGFMVIQFAGIVNDFVTIVISNMGNLKNVVPRRKIEIFVYIGWIIYTFEIGWDVYSTYAVFSPQVADKQLTNCTSYDTALKIYRAVVLSHWGVLFILFAIFTFLMDPFNRCQLRSKINYIESSILALEEDRSRIVKTQTGVHRNTFSCAALCRCCAEGGALKSTLGDVVHLFRVLFDGLDVEYTFLDLVSGFKLLADYHKKLRESGKDPTNLIKRVG